MAISTSHRAPLLRGRIISPRDARSGLDVGGAARSSPFGAINSTRRARRCDRKIKPVTLRQNHTAADSQELLIMKESDIMGVLTNLPARRRRPRKRQSVFPYPEESA